MPLQLESRTRFGLMTRMPTPDAVRHTAAILDKYSLDSVWVGDHLAFTGPILDPFVQLAQVAALNRRVTVGTAVYLVPLRHPGPVAKQVASLDHLAAGRLIFGVGVGGESASDFAVAGVAVNERGARLAESIQVMRKLWSGERVSHQGRFFDFADILMLPAPVQPGGPPIWCGGRQPAALRRAGRLADGYMSYVITPEMFEAALATITQAAEAAGRGNMAFGTAHLLFLQIAESYDEALEIATKALSVRYAMDFRKAAARYCALGRPDEVAAKIRLFHKAGVRHFNLDFLLPEAERDRQIERFAREVRPLLADIGG